ncbi:MAG TPA: hypothetical protein ENJ19_01740 [Gammaproteobacteria bacterium]|nr:hypothetical protein [Gammaproteobacteria bacterium]
MNKKTRRLLAGSAALAAGSLPGLAMAAAEVPRQSRDFGITPHAHYDEVLHHVFLDLAIIGVVFTLVTLYFMFVYKRKHAEEVGTQPRLSTQAMLGWLIIPSALFLADDLYLFVKAWDLHDDYRKVPANAYEIKVTGALWSWSYEYPNGAVSANELVVPVGRPVLLRMTSKDVIHSHYLNKYRVTEDVMPGRVTYEWFMPDEIGESVVTCREYCGMMHSGMYGKVKVVSKEDFDAWLRQLSSQASTATVQGRQEHSAVRAVASL